MTGVGWMAAGFGALGAVFVLAGLVRMLRPVLLGSRRRRWTPVRAEVLAVRQERRVGRTERAGSVTVSVVTYRYRSPRDGAVLEADADLADRDVAVPGTHATVHVDPDDPTRAQYGRAGGGGVALGAAFVVLGAVAVGIGAALWGSAP